MTINFEHKYWRWIILLFSFAFCFLQAFGQGDFFIYLSAANDLGKHLDIFTKTYVDGYHYYYSVLFACILRPFATISFFWVKYFWLLLNALMFFNLMQMFYQSSFISALSQKRKNLLTILLFMVSLRFFIDNIHYSQITILILWCCIRGLFLISKNKPVAGAFLLALGINFKLLPIVLIPYLIYRGNFKETLYIIVFYISFMFIPSLIIGHDYNMALLSSWASLINPTNQIHILDVDERSFHGLSTLLSTLFVKDVPDKFALKLPRNIADVSIQTLSKIILFTRFVLIAFTLYFLKLKIFTPARTKFYQLIEISYILLLIPLIFPHQQHYAFLFAIPAFAVCMYSVVVNGEKYKNKNAIIGILIFIGICFNLKLILGVYNVYYDHYKLITYCALLLIVPLIMVKRNEPLFN